ILLREVRLVADESVCADSIAEVVQDAPSTVPTVVSTVALPTDLVIRLLNVLETLVPNHGRLPVPQTNSQEQTQVQLNVAATQTLQLTPQTT
ncbi:hypothetical protein HAX54_048347, partial [Datura stramonium]|nr:hypothetical protein [Datura stramonium]